MIHIIYCVVAGACLSGIVLLGLGRASPEDIKSYKEKEDPLIEKMRKVKESVKEMEQSNLNATPQQKEAARRRNEAYQEKLEPEVREVFLQGVDKYREGQKKTKEKSEKELMDDYTDMQANEFRWVMFKIFVVQMACYFAGSYHYKTFEQWTIWVRFNQEFKTFSMQVVRPIVGEEHVHKLRNHTFNKVIDSLL